MNLFTAGAPRPAIDGARLSAANDLVKRTLAQHGLMTGQPQTGAWTPPAMSSLGDMLKRTAKMGTGMGNATPMPPADLPKGAEFRQDTFTCPSGSRTFRTYVPASAAVGATGVIVMLHGCTQTPEDFAVGTGMNALAEQHGFIAIYPEQSRGENAQSCWNWFNKADQRRGSGEPAILAGMTTQVCAEFDVERDRTYAAGLSAGAAMAAILGETYGDVFAAIGAHSGLPVGAAHDVMSAFSAMAGNAQAAQAPSQSDHTVRTITFHGTADTTVHPSNGDAIARRARQANAPQSIESTASGETAGRRYTQDTSRDANGVGMVEHWAIDGQGHAWSGGNPDGSYTDPQGPDASAEMIRFFFETSVKDL